LVSHKPFGFMGCKRELPPTKQEISHPYMYKVTDMLSGHYGDLAKFHKKLLTIS
jgi:hypothetical protein